MRLFLFLVSFIISGNLFAQDIPLGQWRSHSPYNNVNAITDNAETIFCGTSGGLFNINKSNSEIQKFSTTDGFATTSISDLKWNAATNQLLIAYANSNIDLLENDKIHRLPEIFDKKNIGRKNINDITFSNKLAYISTAFGIVVFDLQRKEVKDTYFLNVNGTNLEIYQTAILQQNIYAATSNGIYQANLNTTLTNANNWKKHGNTELHPGGISLSVASFNNHIYTVLGNNIYKFDGTSWQVSYLFGVDVKSLKVDNGRLLSIAPFRIIAYDIAENIIFNIQNTSAFVNAADALFAAEGIYIADQSKGVLLSNNSNNFSTFLPNGPSSSFVKDLHYSNGKIILSPGGYSVTYTPLFKNDGFSILENNLWTNYNNQNTPSISTIRDIVIADHDFENKKTYLGSFVNGLIEFNGTDFKIYNNLNSSLQTTIGDAASIRISGIARDQNNNLWVSQFGVDRPLSVKKNGEWIAYSLAESIPSGFAEITGLLIDDQDQKWMPVRNSGLVVFNGAQSKKINFGNNALPGSNVNTITKDKDGAIWIGTDRGIAVIYNPDDVINNVEIEIPQVVEDGFLRPLLDKQNVLSIKVDGANRKWIGTNNGVWLFSENGTKQLQYFNTANSPLLNNRVVDIEINELNGEVFFATDEGVISYKGDATAPVEKLGKVLIYPNPVRPGYQGLIGIKGLTDKARVKITDINGALVYQTVANGGQATWNGKNFNGEEASSGVYLVLISSTDYTDTTVSKIMIIR